MGHYRSNVRDLEFNLFEVFGREEILGSGRYSEIEAETARSILAEVERLSSTELAASLLDSDRTPPVFDPTTNSVKRPEGIKRSFRAYQYAEWYRLDLPAELGGTVVPPSLRWSIAELVLGANPAVHMYSSSASFAYVVWQFGTDDQRKLARWMAEDR